MGLKDWNTSFLGKKLKRKALASARRTSVPSIKKGVLPLKQYLSLENNAHVRDDTPIFSSKDDQFSLIYQRLWWIIITWWGFKKEITKQGRFPGRLGAT